MINGFVLAIFSFYAIVACVAVAIKVCGLAGRTLSRLKAHHAGVWSAPNPASTFVMSHHQLIG